MVIDKQQEKQQLEKSLYFEQYKLFLASIERISDRRDNANRYYLAINTGIILPIVLILNSIETNYLLTLPLLIILFLGFIISIAFYYLINSYKQLNTGKFKLVHKIEKNLPLQLYAEEWRILGKGENKNLYYPFSHIEKLIPIIFGSLYLLSFIGLLISLTYFYCSYSTL